MEWTSRKSLVSRRSGIISPITPFICPAPREPQTDTTSGNDGTTWVYEYDCGGNILSKTRSPYTTETPAADGVTINYTYGNSNWKDQLTEYNGATIQYDNIGNPTDDGTWTYTWENGRQLKEMSKGTVGAEGYMKIEYRYNAEGLRIQKIATEITVSGTTATTTNYILHGKNIVQDRKSVV